MPSYRNKLWDGVIPRSSPWVAAQDAPYGKKEPFDRAVLAECLNGILRAGGGKATTGRFEGRQAYLVEAHKRYKGPREYALNEI